MNLENIVELAVVFDQPAVAAIMGCTEQYSHATRQYTYLALANHGCEAGTLVLIDSPVAGLTVGRVERARGVNPNRDLRAAKWVIAPVSRTIIERFHAARLELQTPGLAAARERRAIALRQVQDILGQLNNENIDRSRPGYQTHRVVPGETMSSISDHYMVSSFDLIGANPQISNPDLIYPGEIVVIPPVRRGR